MTSNNNHYRYYTTEDIKTFHRLKKDGLTHKEIAREMGRTLNAINRLSSRIRQDAQSSTKQSVEDMKSVMTAEPLHMALEELDEALDDMHLDLMKVVMMKVVSAAVEHGMALRDEAAEKRIAELENQLADAKTASNFTFNLWNRRKANR